MIKSWFVSQGKNYETERKGGYILAPKTRNDGAERSFWTNITKVNVGDLIIHYSTGIRSVSRAVETCKEIKIDSELVQTNGWSEDGWILKCEYFDLKSMLSISKFRDEVLKYGREDRSAFNIVGNVKQGYLFELNPVLAAIFLEKAMNQNPKLEELPVVVDFLNQEFETEPLSEKAQKNKKETQQTEVKMTNQMLSNLERLMALHDSTHLVKPAHYKANLPEKFVRNIDVDDSVIPSESVAELADTVLRKYLEEGAINEDEVYEMRFIEFSERTFGIEYPLLLRAKALTFEDSPRYFKKPVEIGNQKFYICSSWTEDQREKLEGFLEKIKIRAESLPEYRGMKINEIAKNVLPGMLREGKASEEEVEKMLTLEYSHETFGIDFPLLVTERNESNIIHYYKFKIPIRGTIYYLCSKWVETPSNNDRPLLEKWIKTHRD